MRVGSAAGVATERDEPRGVASTPGPLPREAPQLEVSFWVRSSSTAAAPTAPAAPAVPAALDAPTAVVPIALAAVPAGEPTGARSEPQPKRPRAGASASTQAMVDPYLDAELASEGLIVLDDGEEGVDKLEKLPRGVQRKVACDPLSEKKELLRLRLEEKQQELQALRGKLLRQALRPEQASPTLRPAEAPPPPLCEGLHLASRLHAERLEEKRRQLQEMMAKRMALADRGSAHGSQDDVVEVIEPRPSAPAAR